MAADVRAHVATYCDLGAEERHTSSREALEAALEPAGSLSLAALVCLMDAQLTSTDNVQRARAVLLLSEAREGPPAALGALSHAAQLLPSAALPPPHAEQLAFFFISKLADWYAAGPSAIRARG